MMQLELLLLLHRDESRKWPAHDAARELRAPPAWVETQLVDFIALGLADACQADGVPAFRFRRTADRAAVVDEVAREYPRRRTTVIKTIFSAAPSDVQRFSDAFRLRGGD